MVTVQMELVTANRVTKERHVKNFRAPTNAAVTANVLMVLALVIALLLVLIAVFRSVPRAAVVVVNVWTTELARVKLDGQEPLVTCWDVLETVPVLVFVRMVSAFVLQGTKAPLAR